MALTARDRLAGRVHRRGTYAMSPYKWEAAAILKEADERRALLDEYRASGQFTDWTEIDPGIEVLAEEIISRDAEIKRLREALEVYANHANWKCPRCGGGDALNCGMLLWNSPGEHGYDISEAALAQQAQGQEEA